jgi:ArsR family transcriptional regulator
MSNTEVKHPVSRSAARSLDPEVFRLNAGLCQALANEKRMEIIYHLSDGPKSATDLRMRTGLSKSSLSQHMSILVDRGLARSNPHGKFVEYELAGGSVVDVYRSIAKLCREILEQRRRLARQL